MSDQNKEIETLFNRAFKEGWTININGLSFTPDYDFKVLSIRPNSGSEQAVARLVEAAKLVVQEASQKSYFWDPDYNADYHIEITLSVGELRELRAALAELEAK